MKTITHKSSYKVGNGQIHLVIMIGDGQFGSSRVIVGDELFKQERLVDRDIGLGTALAGQTISSVSVVTDTVAETNRTSVTYRLTGGPNGAWQHVSEFTV